MKKSWLKSSVYRKDGHSLKWLKMKILLLMMCLASVSQSDPQPGKPKFWQLFRQTFNFIFDQLVMEEEIEQGAQRNLDEIAFNGTFTGLKSKNQELGVYFAWNPRLKAIEYTS